MKVIFLIGSVQAIFFSILVFNKRGKSISDKILGFWLLVLGVQLIFPYLVYGKDYEEYIHFAALDVPLIPLHASLLFIYTKSLISKEDKFQLKWLWHLIAFFAAMLVMIPYVSYSNEDKILLYENKMQLPKHLSLLIFLLPAIIIFYISKTLLLIKNHRENIHHVFSYNEKIDLAWLRNLIISMFIIALTIVIVGITIYFNGVTLVQGDLILYVLMVVFVYAIGYWGYKQGRIFSYQPEKSNKSDISKRKSKETTTTLHKAFSSEERSFIEKMEKHMAANMPYINNELTLYDLATALDVSTSYLSLILNSCLKVNFYQYVNKYRVNEVQKRIKQNDTEKFTLLTIAFESGFNSKASFNRIFKNTTGMTPSQYQKSAETK